MAGLVEQLRSQGNRDAGSNARTVLVGVARSPLSSPLLQPLLDPALFQPLLDSAFTAPVSVQVRCTLIDVLLGALCTHILWLHVCTTSSRDHCEGAALLYLFIKAFACVAQSIPRIIERPCMYRSEKLDESGLSIMI